MYLYIKKLKKSALVIMALSLLPSCKSTYTTASFEETPIPPTPSYSDERYWAVLPEKYPQDLKAITGEFEPKKADVFFIYPTLLTEKKDPSWNADVHKENFRNQVISQSVKYQASAFAKAGNLYVPFYRQSHYKVYVPPHDKYEEVSRGIAYSDVKAAFTYYLEHYNEGRPIIIASHSQGSIMAGMLIKEFFDNQPLQQQLVAAYLPGIRITKEDFSTLSPLNHPTDIGGFVTWNTVKQKHYPENYEKWYKGGVTTNPITWTDSKKAAMSQHMGVLNSDGAIYSNALSIEIIDGLIWSSLPRIPKRFLMSFIKSYHFADINLFWKDIEKNAVDRVAAYLQNKENNAR